MYVTEQVAIPAVALAARVQLAAGVNVPVELVVKLTLPVGVITVPADVSVTVAVQLVPWLTTTEAGVHDTLVDVARAVAVTTKSVVAWLAALLVSPAYVALSPWWPTTIGVYDTEHVAVVPVPLSVQLAAGVKVPVELEVKLTLPVGVVAPAVVTVAVHDVAWLSATVAGVHAREVVVVALAAPPVT